MTSLLDSFHYLTTENTEKRLIFFIDTGYWMLDNVYLGFPPGRKSAIQNLISFIENPVSSIEDLI